VTRAALVAASALVALGAFALAGGGFSPSQGGGGRVSVQEADGSPSASGVRTIVVSNGDLTVGASGSVTIATASSVVEADTWATVLSRGATSGATSPTVASGQQLLLPNGTLTLPGLAFSGGTTTGLFSLGAGSVSVVAGGVEAFRVGSDSFRLRDGTAAAPAFSFFNETNLGMYHADGTGLVFVGGSADNRMIIYENIDQILLQSNLFVSGAGETGGTESAPALMFVGSDQNTGLYHPGTGTVSVTSAGVERLRVSQVGATVTGQLTASTVSATTYSGLPASIREYGHAFHGGTSISITSTNTWQTLDLSSGSLTFGGSTVSGTVVTIAVGGTYQVDYRIMMDNENASSIFVSSRLLVAGVEASALNAVQATGANNTAQRFAQLTGHGIAAIAAGATVTLQAGVTGTPAYVNWYDDVNLPDTTSPNHAMCLVRWVRIGD